MPFREYFDIQVEIVCTYNEEIVMTQCTGSGMVNRIAMKMTIYDDHE